MDLELLQQLNSVIWVLSNLTLLYIAVMLITFVVGYAVLFDPRATTGGRLIFRFAVSLLGVIGLVIVGIFVNPTSGSLWFQYATSVDWYRPLLRLVIYGYVAYSITNLTVFLWIRKFRPEKLRTAKDVDLVKTRKFD